jgi:hypothetical protein
MAGEDERLHASPPGTRPPPPGDTYRSTVHNHDDDGAVSALVEMREPIGCAFVLWLALAGAEA